MPAKYLNTFYNKEVRPFSGYPKKLARYLAKKYHFSQKTILLDIGCGRGDMLKEFKELGFECLGVDREVSPELEEYATVKSVDLVSSPLPFPDESIDVVFHKSVIEHLPSTKNLMEESYRILKPGGKLIIMTPDWTSQIKVFYDDPTHVRPYNCASISSILQMYGFKNIESEKFYQLPSVWKYNFLKALIFPLQLLLPVTCARELTKFTGLKFIRWSVEPSVLGYGEK